MSKLIVEMEMPKVCITKDGYYGNCPMDRVWCVQRNAPSGTKMRDAYAEMTENIPSWCPICGVLPDEHGDLVDRDALGLKVQAASISEYGRIMYERMIGENLITSIVLNAPTVIAAEGKDDEQIH